MARKRMIDPRIWASEDFARMSLRSRIVWIGLISNADDEGRGMANPAFVRSQIFPYEEVNLEEIQESFCELEKNMEILFYEVDGKKFFQLKNWSKFQMINRPTPSHFPAPPNTEFSEKILDLGNVVQENEPLQGDFQANFDGKNQSNEGSMKTHGGLTEGLLPKNEKERERKIRKEFRKESVKEKMPTLQETQSGAQNFCGASPPRAHLARFGKFQNVLLTEKEHASLMAEPDGAEAIEFFSEYREIKGYKAKNDNLAIRKWAFSAVREQRARQDAARQQQFLGQGVGLGIARKESPIEQLGRILCEENDEQNF